MNQEGFGPELGKGVHNASTSVQEQAALIGYDDLRFLARAQMRFKRIGKIVDIDHGLRNAGGGQAIEHMIDKRAPLEADKRLGDLCRQRPHAHAFPGGQDHRCLWVPTG